jgi:hypothetical protein
MSINWKYVYAEDHDRISAACKKFRADGHDMWMEADLWIELNKQAATINEIMADLKADR